MGFPSINPAVKCVLRWYRDPGQRVRNQKDCDLEAASCPWAVITKRDSLLPFQFIAGYADTYGMSEPTAWRLMDLEGNELFDMEDSLPLLTVESFASNFPGTLPARDYIICDEEFNGGFNLGTGVYEMEIDTPSGTYYSETFRVCADDACLHRMTWRSCGDVGTQRYYNRDFTNVFYWEASSTKIGKPTPIFEEEEDTKADGTKIKTLKRKDVRWTIDFLDLVWPLMDSVSEMPLHDEITLQLCDRDDADDLLNVVMETSWNEGETCQARASITFEVDEATSVTGCCDGFVPACPTACVTADGIWPIHTPTIGETFLMPNGKYGIFYGLDEEVERIDANGFGSFVRCNSNFAYTTQEGYEAVYYTGGEWFPAIYIVEILLDSPGVYLVTTNGWGTFGVQFEYTIDGSTWVDVAGVYEFGDSYIELPEGTLCVRASIVSENCTVATSSPVTVINGFDMTAGALSGRYVDTGLTYNGRTWYVLQGEEPGTTESVTNSCVYADGIGWAFTDGSATITYTSSDIAANPTLCVTWVDETGNMPTPTLSDIEC